MNSMKCAQLAIALLALSAFAVGCKPASEPSAPEARDATARQFERAERQTQEAARELNDYTYAQRAEFVTTMQGQLNAIQRDLDELEAKIERSSDAAKAEAQPRLKALRDQASRLNTHLDEARDATESTWDNVKAGFKEGYSDLKDGFTQVRQWVSEKIAP
jgi:cytochrome c556